MKIREGTLLLLKSIGLPGLVEGKIPPLNKALSLLQLAELNKIPLLYLESIRKFRKYPLLNAQLSHYRDKHRKTLDLTTLASSLLEETGIRYTIFKTLKPFPPTPANIDVLLWSERDLTVAFQTLEERGLKPLEYRPKPKGDPYGGYAETTQMKKLIEWKPKIELKDGVKSYYHWAKQNKNVIPQWM